MQINQYSKLLSVPKHVTANRWPYGVIVDGFGSYGLICIFMLFLRRMKHQSWQQQMFCVQFVGRQVLLSSTGNLLRYFSDQVKTI